MAKNVKYHEGKKKKKQFLWFMNNFFFIVLLSFHLSFLYLRPQRHASIYTDRKKPRAK